MLRTTQKKNIYIILTFFSNQLQNTGEAVRASFSLTCSYQWDALLCVTNSGSVHLYPLSNYYLNLPGKKGTSSCVMHPSSLWTHIDFHPVSSACDHSLIVYRIQRNILQTLSEPCQQEHLAKEKYLNDYESLGNPCNAVRQIKRKCRTFATWGMHSKEHRRPKCGVQSQAWIRRAHFWGMVTRT